MKKSLRTIGVLALSALGACAQDRHPIDRQLSQMRPDAVVPLVGLECVPVEQACVLVTRDQSQRNLVSFGTS